MFRQVRSAYSVVALLSATLFFSCKIQHEEGEGGASGLSSVAIRLPEQVRGVSKAVLKGSGRTFEQSIATDRTGGSVVTFAQDIRGNALRVGENLGTVTLELTRGDTVVYSGRGDKTPFAIQAGENRISFQLECRDQSICPDGASLEVVKVEGSTGDPARTPTILAEIRVQDSGMTVPQKRALLAQCKSEVAKKSCQQWGTEHAQGQGLCNGINTVNPTSVCEGNARVYGKCLDDYIKDCQTLGVVRRS